MWALAGSAQEVCMLWTSMPRQSAYLCMHTSAVLPSCPTQQHDIILDICNVKLSIPSWLSWCAHLCMHDSGSTGGSIAFRNFCATLGGSIHVASGQPLEEPMWYKISPLCKVLSQPHFRITAHADRYTQQHMR